MSDLTDVNLRAVLAEIRPNSEYHWRGNGQLGNDYEAIGQWRDPATTKPTAAEIRSAWPDVQAKLSPAGLQEEEARRLSQSFEWRVIARVLARLGVLSDVETITRYFREEAEAEMRG